VFEGELHIQLLERHDELSHDTNTTNALNFNSDHILCHVKKLRSVKKYNKC
jgi:hypothetical protein